MEQLDESSNLPVKPSVRQVFTNKDFFKLWIGQFVSNSGSGISFIVLPLFIFAYTGSTLWLGIISIVEFIPVLLFSPIAGVFVDSHNRKHIMIVSDLLNTIFILIIPVLITFDTVMSREIVLLGITFMVFLANTVNRFFMPAREASIPRLVDDDELGIAVSISQTTFQIIMIIGPIVGTIIATLIGFSFAFILDGATFIFSAIFISFIKTDLKPILNKSEKLVEKPSILLGTKKVFQIKSLRFLIIIFSILIFANSSLNSFLVAFAQANLHMSNEQFGLSIAILGGSGVITGVLLTNKISQIKRPILVVASAFLAGGIILFPIILVTNAWELYLMFIFLGPINVFINIPINVIFLRDTTDNIRGQVFSSLNMMMSIFTILGLIYGVILSPIIGLRLLFFYNSILFIIIGLAGVIYLIFVNDLDNVSTDQIIGSEPVSISGD